MIQAAGRCNREGKQAAEDSNVYIFSLAEREYMPGQRKQMDVANSLMNRGMDFSDPETVEQYFRELYYLQRNVLDKRISWVSLKRTVTISRQLQKSSN